MEVHPGGLETAPIGLVSLMGAFFFLASGLHSQSGKTLEIVMVFLGYIMTFITGVAVGFVFSVIILFRKRLDQTP